MLVPFSVQLKNDKLEEAVPGLQEEFPYTSLHVEMGNQLSMRCATWHWHCEFEFFYVLKGSISYHLEDGVHVFHQGDGGFLNGNILHMTSPDQSLAMTVHNVQIMHRRFISGGIGNVFDNKYISPIYNCQDLKIYKFDQKEPAHNGILNRLKQARLCEEKGEFAYEFEIRHLISSIWCDFYLLTKEIWSKSHQEKNLDTNRIKDMIRFINHKYSEKITLDQIADSANISGREALRCFQRCIKMTPNEFLTQRRIQEASIRLIDSDDPITLIGAECGFKSSSYFGKIFKDHLSCSPREFRNKHQNI